MAGPRRSHRSAAKAYELMRRRGGTAPRDRRSARATLMQSCLARESSAEGEARYHFGPVDAALNNCDLAVASELVLSGPGEYGRAKVQTTLGRKAGACPLVACPGSGGRAAGGSHEVAGAGAVTNQRVREAKLWDVRGPRRTPAMPALVRVWFG